MTDYTSILPIFSDFKPQDLSVTIKDLIADNERQLQHLLASNTSATATATATATVTDDISNNATAKSSAWCNLMQPLDNMCEHISHYWSVANHLHAVCNSEQWRQAVEQSQPLLTAYYADLSQNQQLYAAIERLQQSKAFAELSEAQQKAVQNDLRDFKLSGVALDDDVKQRFKALSLELSKLATKFAQNVQDATDHWHYHTSDSKQIKGIPADIVALAAQTAAEQKLEGWAFSLQGPVFVAVMSYAEDDALRQAIYQAYVTRASDQGPQAGKWDNAPVIQAILKARLQQAQLLGFKHYAELSLATKMAEDCQQVLDFLQQLATASYVPAQQQYQELCDFALKKDGVEHLAPWQIGYYSEQLRQARYDFSEQDLRPYFPLPQVLKGLFEIVQRLYGVYVVQLEQFDSYHPDVRCYAIYDQDPAANAAEAMVPRAYFYLDPYARKAKRGGAWMDDCRSRRQLDDGSLEIPVAFLVCNFTPPAADQPALLTHDEVVTLFHEFGHGLHHMLTKIDCLGVSGINGVAWDAVELPSQFMENWAYDRESLDLFAKHYQTGEKIPQPLYEKMQQARHFQSALQMMRQLEFSLFDFMLHMACDAEQMDQAQTILDRVREQVRVTPVYAQDRFQNGFSHIFAGGYAAGYYSYKWAEVMAADAFALFKQQGIFCQDSSRKFLHEILEQGGSKDAMQLFKNFRGREPKVDALLAQEGIGSE